MTVSDLRNSQDSESSVFVEPQHPYTTFTEVFHGTQDLDGSWAWWGRWNALGPREPGIKDSRADLRQLQTPASFLGSFRSTIELHPQTVRILADFPVPEGSETFGWYDF